jgi:ATP-binding cassette, subfamily B, multidrug efflux pump
MSQTAVNLDHHDAEREDKVRVGTSIREIMVRLWPYFMRRKLQFFGSIAAVFAGAAAARLAVVVFGLAIDRGVLKNDRDVVAMAAIAYLILQVGGTLMEYLQQVVFGRLGNRILFDLRSELVRHVQDLPISYFDKTPSGRIVTRLTNDVVSLGEVFTQGLIMVFAALVSMLAIVMAMFAISWKLTIATLIVAPPIIYIVKRLSDRVLDALRASKGKLAAINAFVAENVGGMRVLQLYGRVGKNNARFQKLSGEYRQDMMNQVLAYALLWPLVSLFNGVSVAVALYYGGRLTLDGTITTGAMVAFLLHTRAFIDPLHLILEKYQVLQNSLSGAERVFTLQDEKVESGSEARVAVPAEIAQKSERLRGEVEFRNVSFRYRTELPLAIENINLSIKPGQSVALVGRTGSGKSTSIALMQRLYDVSDGMIFIDGKPITDYPRKSLRSRIGVVQQDTFMFRGTISQNIGLGDPSVSRERTLRAAAGARLSEFLRSHANGLEAKVEERGANLSFGERQLIAFARILAFDPDILILDEATANIDSHTEQLIQEATRKVRQGRTSLIIAHRISTIMDCDKIVVLDRGHIAEEGTHAELYAKGGIYRKLCDAQFGEGKSIDDAVL